MVKYLGLFIFTVSLFATDCTTSMSTILDQDRKMSPIIAALFHTNILLTDSQFDFLQTNEGLNAFINAVNLDHTSSRAREVIVAARKSGYLETIPVFSFFMFQEVLTDKDFLVLETENGMQEFIETIQKSFYKEKNAKLIKMAIKSGHLKKLPISLLWDTEDPFVIDVDYAMLETAEGMDLFERFLKWSPDPDKNTKLIDAALESGYLKKPVPISFLFNSNIHIDDNLSVLETEKEMQKFLFLAKIHRTSRSLELLKAAIENGYLKNIPIPFFFRLKELLIFKDFMVLKNNEGMQEFIQFVKREATYKKDITNELMNLIQAAKRSGVLKSIPVPLFHILSDFLTDEDFEALKTASEFQQFIKTIQESMEKIHPKKEDAVMTKNTELIKMAQFNGYFKTIPIELFYSSYIPLTDKDFAILSTEEGFKKFTELIKKNWYLHRSKSIELIEAAKENGYLVDLTQIDS